MTSRRLPADAGLPSLGLIMQLGGGFFLIYQLMLAAIINLKSPLVFILLLAGAVRSGIHYGVGRRFAAGDPSALGAARGYVGFGVIHALATGLLVAMLAGSTKLPFGMLVWLVLVLSAWPIIVAALVLRRSVRERMQHALEEAEHLVSADHGVTGAGVLMFLLGTVGAVFGGVALLGSLDLLGRGAQGPLLLVTLGLLVGRSVVHAAGGVQLWREPGFARLDTWTRYYWFACIATVVAVVVFLFAVAGKELASAEGILMLTGMSGLLVIWPLSLRAFAKHHNSLVWGEHEPPALRPPRDGALTTLGYVLVALGGLGLAFWLLDPLLPDRVPRRMTRMFAIGQEPAISPYLQLVRIGLTLAAGIALVTMHGLYRVLANVYGAVAIVLAAIELWPLLELSRGFDLRNPTAMTMGLMAFGAAIAALIVPATTLWLANRRLPEQAASLPELAETFE